MDLTDELTVAWIGLAYLHTRKLIHKRKRRAKPKMWVSPYLQKRGIKGRFKSDFQDMRDDPEYFEENFHMTVEQFDHLYKLVKKQLEPVAFTRPDIITGLEKLAVTLEFLASGDIQRHLASSYRISKQRLGKIIESTCTIIHDALQKQYAKDLTAELFTEVGNQFNARWNFPNVLGCLDGKHVYLKCPPQGASQFFNYKGTHSIVLMAAADADYRFLYYDIGAYGSEGDSGIFRRCELGQLLAKNRLKVPEDRLVYGTLIPYVFLADAAFPLNRHILTPYQPTARNPLTDEQNIFNYRLSRARRCVENAFGILCVRWQCLARTMYVRPAKAQRIVAASCALHNYLMASDRRVYCPVGFGDSFANDGTVIQGNWRSTIPTNSMFENNLPTGSNRISAQGKSIRDHLAEFFTSPQGAVPWQRNSACL